MDGQAGLPDGATISIGTSAAKPEPTPAADAKAPEVNAAALALRQSRAAVLLAGALVVGGVLAALSLPSSIYPPLEFPRIVIVAHSGTLPPQSMSLIVTRPIEQVDHGGAGCAGACDRRASAAAPRFPRSSIRRPTW